MKYWNINIKIHHFILNFAEKELSKSRFENAIKLVYDLAKFETYNYIGFLSSIKAEKILVECGRKINQPQTFPSKIKKTRKVLHIATEIYDIGGHSRVIFDWIKYDNSQSEIILTDQQTKFDNPKFEGDIHLLKSNSIIDKSIELRTILLTNYYDTIIIHQHSEDVIPTLAMWDMKESSESKILFYNHANFRFSLGNIIAHTRINITRGDYNISKAYRYPIENKILPFIVETKKPIANVNISSQANNTIKFIAIGNPHKFRPFEGANMLLEWNQFLLKNINCELNIIGCTALDFKNYCPGEKQAQNLILSGHIVDPQSYFENSDYILEIYPLSSGLGMIEGLAHGLTPILSYCGNAMIIGNETNHLFPSEIVKQLNYKNADQYFDFISKEIATKKYLSFSHPIIERFMATTYSLKTWVNKLDEIYNSENKIIENQQKADKIISSEQSKKWYRFETSTNRTFFLLNVYHKNHSSLNLSFILVYLNFLIVHKKYRINLHLIDFIKNKKKQLKHLFTFRQ